MFRRMQPAASLLFLMIGAMAMATPADAQPGVKVGTLTCNVAGGWGFILGSSKDLNCIFTGFLGIEYYTGTISKFGMDIGYTQGGVLIWTVVAPTGRVAPGSLTGAYVGGSASATIGVGVGANGLIGGNGNTIALQPLSIEGNQGLNVAAGIGALTLNWRR